MQPTAMNNSSVCLSVRMSVKHVNCEKTNESSAPSSYIIWKVNASSFPTKREVGTSLSTWNFRPKWPTPFKNNDFQSIFAHSASAITLSEKSSIITNRNSTIGFPISLRWTGCPLPITQWLKCNGMQGNAIPLPPIQLKILRWGYGTFKFVPRARQHFDPLIILYKNKTHNISCVLFIFIKDN